jgi:transposase
VRDVSSIKATIDESGIKEVIVIGDKGFYSEENIRLLTKAGLKYILPLKRNSEPNRL